MKLSLDYLERFFHSTPAGIGLMTSNIFCFSNNQLADITGYNKREMKGKHTAVLYPSERESKRIEKIFYPALREKAMTTIETKWRRKNGTIVDVFLGALLLDSKIHLEKGDVAHETILMMVFDISDRKMTEQAVRKGRITMENALKYTGASFWEWSIEEGHVRFNDEWTEMIGYKRKELDPHIRSWKNLVHPEDWSHVRKTLNDHLWGDSDSYSLQYRLKAKSGSWIWVFDYGRVMEKDEQHYPLKVIVTTIDITSLKKVEHKIPYSGTGENSSNWITSFYPVQWFRKKNISLEGMEGFVSLLRNPHVPAYQRNNYLNLMMNSGSRIHELVHNLMNISRLNSGQVQVQPEEFNVNTLLREIYTMFNPLTRQKDLELYLHTPFRDELSYIFADATKVRQILRYLLDNAFRYTPQGVIEFGYQLVDEEMRFFVKDTGYGLPPNQHMKIFEPLVTAKRVNSGHVGSGLGLTVAKGLARLLDSRLWVHSEEGQGSIFYLTIPYVTGMKDIRQEIKNLPNIKEQWSNQSMTLLIVEDDHSNVFFLSEAMKNIRSLEVSLNVLIATNGREAVDFCRSHPVDVVLMDIKLPVMDGLTACRKIKLLKPGIPVIAQTAYAFPSDKKKILAAGCNDYLVKPIPIGLIQNKVIKYLKMRNRNKIFIAN